MVAHRVGCGSSQGEVYTALYINKYLVIGDLVTMVIIQDDLNYVEMIVFSS